MFFFELQEYFFVFYLIIKSNIILSVQISEYIRNNIKDGISVSNIANHFGYNADYSENISKRISASVLKNIYILSA